MASNGAVFLPAAGYRRGTNIMDTGSKVIYWSSSEHNYDKQGNALITYEGAEHDQSILGECFGFDSKANIPLKSDGCAVRLVRKVK